MWRIPSPLISGSGADIVETITSDTYIGDLYTYLGSPAGVKSVVLTVDAADAGEIIISNSFAIGSTFSFVAINGGRILGVGGDGGNGGPDFGATGEAGEAGSAGSAAIKNNGTYPVSINVDDGYLFGGGGGGGGGSYTDTGTGGDAGGGGGGGQGFNGGAGGTVGPFLGSPAPTAGTVGTISTAGAGGGGGGTSIVDGAGGDGGTWGLGGSTGRSSNLVSIGSLGSFFYYGGTGGAAGQAYNGIAAATLSGAASETSLRAAGRILGELNTPKLVLPNFFSFDGSSASAANIGISFESTGSTLEINTTSSPSSSTTYYLTNGSGTGSNYEVRVRGLSGDVDGSFASQAAVPGTWVDISSLRQWYWSVLNQTRGALFEIRRADIVGTTSTSDEVMRSFYVKASHEDLS